MKKLFSILTCGFLSLACAQADVLSPGIYNPQTTHTYYLLTASPWTTAESAAVSMGGHLVTVNNAAENSWLLSTFSNFGGQQRALWTGLNDRAQEGTFIWSSGETAPYRNWEMGQPDDGGGYYPTEDFVMIWPSPGPRSPGLWNDYIDATSFQDLQFLAFGIVEVPEPSACALLLFSAIVTRFAARPIRRRS